MEKIQNKIMVFLLALWGEIIKVCCNLRLIVPKCISGTNVSKRKVIISLTSYGRRVNSVLPFTIISLLRQTYKPDMIVLWLDSDNWNDEKLPKSIKRLIKYGLTIRYCKDLKSYKKLIPSLEAFPNDLIITCDDDIYYRRNMVERLIDEYEKDPTKIYCHRAHLVGLSDQGTLKPYNDWEQEASGVCGNNVFPTSGGGCLYHKTLLYNDVCKEDLFMSLSPKADDVWLYFMAFLNKTQCSVLPYKGYIYIPLDVFYQHFHKDSSLYSSNCLESENDKQIKAVMKYYNIIYK